jgi:hypothetical protein
MQIRLWIRTITIAVIGAHVGVFSAAVAQSAAPTVEVYVTAYRRLARQTCRAGATNALEESLTDIRGTLTGLSPSDRGAVNMALDSAHAELVREGGCETLKNPARRVLIDSFEGHAWGSPLSEAASRRDAHADANGFLILTRHVKFAGVKGDAIYTYTGSDTRELLLNGRYRLPIKDNDCGKRWRAVEQEIVKRHPSLRVAGASAIPSDDTRCAADTQAVTTFRNPDTGAMEARMTLDRDAKGKPVIDVEYPGLAMR